MESGIATFVSAAQLVDRRISHDAEVPDLTQLMKDGASGGDSGYAVRDVRYEGPAFFASRKIPIPQVLIDELNHILSAKPKQLDRDRKKSPTRFHGTISLYVRLKSFMGLFPELNRAWMTVDNRLYLWNYDSPNDFSAYDGLDQIIVSVAVMKPKPDVFLDEIKHILVLATPVEIVILAIMFERGDIKGELKIMPTKFALPSDNVNMVKIVGTNTGRIFLGGQDGSLNEVVYQAEEGWFTPKCRKLNYTANRIMQFLPSFLHRNSHSSPIVDLAVDDTRNIFYALHADSSIQVVDLGIHGDSFRLVTHMDRVGSEAVKLVPQMYAEAGGSSNNKSTEVIGIYTIPASESTHYHLVGVTRTGLRLYFGTHSWFYGTSSGRLNYDITKRPDVLRLYHVRLPPTAASGQVPPPSSPGGRFAQKPETVSCKPVDVGSACYSSGVTLLADNLGAAGDALLAVGPDPASIFGQFPTSQEHAGRKFGEFRELSFTLKMVDGKAHALAEVPLSKLAPKSLAVLSNDSTLLQNDLALQAHLLPQREFVCLSASRVLLLQRTWPVDNLRHLLRSSGGSDTQFLREFRKTYGVEETCAMCLIIMLNDATSDRSIAELAKGMFYHAGGVPRMELPTSFVPINNYATPVPAPPEELAGIPILSGCHDGIALYLARLLRPIWHQPLFISGAGSPFFSNSKMPRDQLDQLQRQLLALMSFIESMVTFQAPQQQQYQQGGMTPGTPLHGRVIQALKRDPNDLAREKERQSLQALHSLIRRSSELLSLLDLVAQCDSARVMNLVSSSNKAKLVQMRFGVSLAQNEEALYTDLVDAIFRTVSADDAEKRDRISDILRGRCPSLFKEEDKIRVKAQEFAQRAILVANGDFAEQWNLLEDSLELYVKVAAYLVERNLLADIIQLYVYFRFYRGAVELVLRCALATDPERKGVSFYKTRESTDDRGKAAFEKRYNIYANLNSYFEEMRFAREPNFSGLADAGALPPRPVVTPEQLQILFDDGMKFARERDDELFHYWMYEFEYNANATSQLIELDTPYVEWWLKNCMDNRAVSLDLLSKYYQHQKRDAEAARCKLDLAALPDTDLPADVHISLDDRINSLAEAQLLSVSSQNQTLVREINDRLDLARIQSNIHDAIEQMYQIAQDPNFARALTDLGSRLYDSSELWKQFAAKYGLREPALDIVKVSGSRNIEVVKRLWKSIFDDYRLDSGGFNLDQLKTKVRELTFRYYPAVDTVFPLEFIILELELISLQQVYSVPPETDTRLADPRNGANVTWVCEALMSDMSNTNGVPIPTLVSVYSDLIERGGAYGVPPDAKTHLIRVLGRLLKYAFSRVGALPDAQLRQLRSNRVRSTVERLLAELPKFGTEGSHMKDDLYRYIDSAMH